MNRLIRAVACLASLSIAALAHAETVTVRLRSGAGHEVDGSLRFVGRVSLADLAVVGELDKGVDKGAASYTRSTVYLASARMELAGAEDGASVEGRLWTTRLTPGEVATGTSVEVSRDPSYPGTYAITVKDRALVSLKTAMVGDTGLSIKLPEVAERSLSVRKVALVAGQEVELGGFDVAGGAKAPVQYRATATLEP